MVASQKERRETGTENETEVGQSDTEGERIDLGNSKKAKQGVTSSRELQTSCRCTKLSRLGAEAVCLLAEAHPRHDSGFGGVAGLFLVPFLKCFG